MRIKRRVVKNDVDHKVSKEQDSQCMYDVTLKRVRETVVAVEKQ
jgi:hypothetical protein